MYEKLRIESEIRELFNQIEHLNARKEELSFNGSKTNHEFDIYEKGKVIGGISTSPWKNRTGTNNSGGQDRVATELLWLSLWQGQERRVMILSNNEMASRLLMRWEGCSWPTRWPVPVCHRCPSRTGAPFGPARVR